MLLDTGMLAAVAGSVGPFVAYMSIAATVGAALVGLVFRGAAEAWREERDAAVDKADRLEEKVDEQAKEITMLKTKVGDLEKRTNYDAYADRSGREHQAILDELRALTRNVGANTTAVEFLLRQVFPTVELPQAPPV